MEARIVGPEEELGDVRAGVNHFGNVLTREWSPVTVTADQAAKLKTNRYVETRGEDPETDEAVAEAQKADVIKKRLDELGVQYRSNASLKALGEALTKAEAAQAKAEEEAQKAADDAAKKAQEAAAKAPAAPTQPTPPAQSAS